MRRVLPSFTHWLSWGLLFSVWMGSIGCSDDPDDGRDASTLDQDEDSDLSAPDGVIPADAGGGDGDFSDTIEEAEPGDPGEEAVPDGDEPDQDQADALVIPPGPWEVTEPGFYNIGYLTFQVVYQPQGLEGDRELRVCAWYPTMAVEGDYATYFGVYRQRRVLAEPPVASIGPMPVLLFSHGHGSIAEQSFYLTEFFASHGWLVLAPDHTGNLFVDLSGPMKPEILYLRPQDMSAVLDALDDLPSDHLLYGQSGEDVVMSGHSFGGYTTLSLSGAGYDVEAIVEACEEGTAPSVLCTMITPESLAMLGDGFADPRIDVAIPQAPGGSALFGPEYIADIDIPVLLMTGALDRTTPDRTEGDPIWAALDGAGDLRTNFTTGGHFTFSNMCSLMPAAAQDDGCGEGFLPPEQAYAIINAYALAFARHHLWGDQTVSDLLEGSRILSEEVVLLSKQ
ncbi:MAG: hypothetical protein JW797_10280 [Bradymonadales bacterium]|nr:hypothetical protein [Bradymonadales bacterium]